MPRPAHGAAARDRVASDWAHQGTEGEHDIAAERGSRTLCGE